MTKLWLLTTLEEVGSGADEELGSQGKDFVDSDEELLEEMEGEGNDCMGVASASERGVGSGEKAEGFDKAGTERVLQYHVKAGQY